MDLEPYIHYYNIYTGRCFKIRKGTKKMNYLALYRAWRPQRFAEVVGQKRIVTALKNALAKGRLSHAYLFSGPRGTGKTSIAKIIAKAANCENFSQGEPCNTCSACTDINNGNFMDVIEIDAASNRGIDEIRSLREKVRVLPAQGKCKVYIIDEVHMLSTEAFNALLKTIEEPPGSVVFILATTEPQKIPATIRSRCQIYNFRRLTLDEIIDRLTQVANIDGIIINHDAIRTIAQRADGGMRDALSMLDQVFSYKGNIIEKDDVLEVLGLVDEQFMTELMEAVITGNINGIVKLLGIALNQGKETQQIAREAVVFLRDVLLYVTTEKKDHDTVFYEDVSTLAKRQKEYLEKNNIIQALRKMMEIAERLRYSEGNRLILELGFIDISGCFLKPDTVSIRSANPSRKKSQEKAEKTDDRHSLWNQILAGVKSVKIPTHALLSQGKLLGFKDNIISIGFKKGYKFHKEKMEEKANREILEKVVSNIAGREVQVKFVFLDEEQNNDNDIVVKKAVEYFGEEIVRIKE